MEFKYSNIPSKQEVEIAAKIIDDFGRENLLKINCKNFKSVSCGENNIYGVEFNLPTNKSKGNRCMILKYLEEENSYDLYITSKYYDKINNKMVCGDKGHLEKSTLDDIRKEFYNITCL